MKTAMAFFAIEMDGA